MTRDDIIRMAVEAGIVVTGEAIWKLCELVAAAEREECAQAVEVFDKTFQTGGVIAHAIRARSHESQV
jgi:hypothetical protein